MLSGVLVPSNSFLAVIFLRLVGSSGQASSETTSHPIASTQQDIQVLQKVIEALAMTDTNPPRVGAGNHFPRSAPALVANGRTQRKTGGRLSNCFGCNWGFCSHGVLFVGETEHGGSSGHGCPNATRMHDAFVTYASQSAVTGGNFPSGL